MKSTKFKFDEELSDLPVGIDKESIKLRFEYVYQAALRLGEEAIELQDAVTIPDKFNELVDCQYFIWHIMAALGLSKDMLHAASLAKSKCIADRRDKGLPRDKEEEKRVVTDAIYQHISQN